MQLVDLATLFPYKSTIQVGISTFRPRDPSWDMNSETRGRVTCKPIESGIDSILSEIALRNLFLHFQDFREHPCNTNDLHFLV